MGSAVPLTTTAAHCCYNWFRMLHDGQLCSRCTYCVSRSGLRHNSPSSIVAVEGWSEPHSPCVGPGDTAGPRCVGAEPRCNPPGGNHPCCAPTAACRRLEQILNCSEIMIVLFGGDLCCSGNAVTTCVGFTCEQSAVTGWSFWLGS